MAKIDPNKLRRKPKGFFTQDVADSVNGVSHSLKFRFLSTTEMLAAQDDAEKLIQQYIVNGEPLGSVDGEPVHASTRAIHLASTLAFAQEGPLEDRYTIVELLMLMASDEIVDGLTVAFNKIMKGAPKEDETLAGNLSKTTEVPSLAVVSNS